MRTYLVEVSPPFFDQNLCLGARTKPFEAQTLVAKLARSKLGVPVPKAIWLNDKAEIDFDYVGARVGLPFVLKPTNKSDSLGFRIIRSKDQLHKIILSNRKYNFSPLIAQTFIPGVDILLAS
jgi:glutathione synthase/RimK-type ligase-like ATP-grasp enzyme